MRCFVGIQLPDEVRTALADACAEVRAADPDWDSEKWVPAENLHITLAFLGNISGEQAGALRRSLGDQLGGVRGFELPFARLRPMPSARRARMLWANWDDPEGACAGLASRVGLAAASCGVVVEAAQLQGARHARPRAQAPRSGRSGDGGAGRRCGRRARDRVSAVGYLVLEHIDQKRSALRGARIMELPRLNRCRSRVRPSRTEIVDTEQVFV